MSREETGADDLYTAMALEELRSEQEIFRDLENLCSSSGYVHAIAYFCSRDNIVGYSRELTADDMQRMFSPDRLIRTEITTLIGLLIKGKVDFTLPAPDLLQEYIDRTEALLLELHNAMSAVAFGDLNPESIAESSSDPFSLGAALREPIFYGGESAYSFQYRDLATVKYAKDNDWLRANRRFSIEEAVAVAQAVERVQQKQHTQTFRNFRKVHPTKWTLLPAFRFTADEVAENTKLDARVVTNILDSLSLASTENNQQFQSLHDFNVVTATPLLRADDGAYILFQIYSLAECLYDSPYYWMGADSSYVTEAMGHRGQFTEEFAAARLRSVFGASAVYSNVHILESKGKEVGEIDTLVLFGDRVIVTQAKSKRLTLESRRGNDGQIKGDFKKGIQDSYDQARKCAEFLIAGKHTFRNATGSEIAIPSLKRVYIFCVVSDHYPALSFQTRQFLKTDKSEKIAFPFVMDVFTLDAMAEMLESPLRLLSYVDQRTEYGDRLLASHELTILAYHLKKNLWLSNEADFVMLSDDLTADLDVAMAVRRGGVHGKRTPDGILTRLARTAVGRMVQQIERQPSPATIELGFLLLTLSEDTVTNASKVIERLARETKRDGINHDLTMAFHDAKTGLTVHCNYDDPKFALGSLQAHCFARKYTEKADRWFGICINPNDASPRFGVNLDYKWEQDAEMDAKTRSLSSSKAADLRTLTVPKGKIGRNELCPCGSGLKYKRCHLGR